MTRIPRSAIRVAALLGPLLTCLVLTVVRDHVTAAASVLVLVLWVVAAAATGDRLAGVLAALSGGVWFDFFLTQPYLRLTIDDPEDVEAAILLVLISLAVTEVALWGVRQQAHASRRSGYLDGVLSTSRSVATGEVPKDALVDVVGQQIAEVLGVQEWQYVGGPVLDPRVALLDHDGDLTRAGTPVDVDRHGLPTDEYVAVPVKRDDQWLGHFRLTSASRVVDPTHEQRRVAVLLADQVAGVVTSPATSPVTSPASPDRP